MFKRKKKPSKINKIIKKNSNLTGSLQQLSLDLQMEGGGERAQLVVGGGAEVRVARAQVQEGHVQEGARYVLRANLLVDCHRVLERWWG